MALFLARIVIIALGVTYTILGIYMAATGSIKEFARRTYLPMTILIGDPPPMMFEDPNFDKEYNRNFVPFIIAGIMLAAVGISFLFNVP